MNLWHNVVVACLLFCVLSTKVRSIERELLSSLNESELVRGSGCNLFQGRWVFDASFPIYESSGCPFIDPEFDCQKYGRPDRQYLKYSWRPDSCALPRFDGGDFLRRNRGKKIMFVGDSLSLNQWQSLTCMLHASVPNAKTTVSRSTLLSYVTFQGRPWCDANEPAGEGAV